MANIKIIFKDGSIKEFLHEGRAGGSYTKTIRYEGNFAIIKDELGVETMIPSDNIDQVIVELNRGSF